MNMCIIMGIDKKCFVCYVGHHVTNITNLASIWWLCKFNCMENYNSHWVLCAQIPG